MGWKSGKEEKIPSKMLQTVYGQTADRQLKVVMSEESIKLKNAVNAKQKIIYDNIGKTSTAKIIPDTKIDKQVQEAIPDQKSKPLGQQVDELKKPVVTVSGTGATVDISKEGTEKVKSKKRNWSEKTKGTRKVLSKAALLSILSKIGKTAGLIAPTEPIQALNEAIGGEEGILPTTESGNILGFIPPTTTKETESWTELFGIPTYPEGHEKAGQHIHSIKDYEELNKPETKQFEQQDRL